MKRKYAYICLQAKPLISEYENYICACNINGICNPDEYGNNQGKCDMKQFELVEVNK